MFGRTLSATGAFFGLLWSLFYWSLWWFDLPRYRFDFWSIAWLAIFSLACILSMVAAATSKLENRPRGAVILGLSLFILPLWWYPNQLSSDLLSMFFLYWWIGFLIAGSLILLFPYNRFGRAAATGLGKLDLQEQSQSD